MQTLFRHAAWPPLLMLLLCQRIQGQNLVPNPSFEDVNFCAEFNQPCSPSAWFFLSRKFTTGYFPRFPSATGRRHLQIVVASRETVNRQYWETMLLCPLQAGERYSVSLKIASPGNKGELSTICPNLHDIGLWFTTRFVFVQGDSILQPRSWLSLTGATIKDLKNGWFEIKKEFVPTSNSGILIVGNFVRTPNADIMERRNWPSPTIDILIDDISVLRVKGTACTNYEKIKDSLYAITRRHSDNPPGYPNPDLPDTPLSISPPPRIDTLVIHNIQFDFDKYLMQNPDTLLRYRRILTRPGIKKIQVVGFTDDTGPAAYNLDLSKKRAREIARLLTSTFNIPPALIEAEGRGISRDYLPKDLNRRVEIYIFHE
jgi:outer membrane protein OmpA-like peptidoglycan-associated protein